MGRWEAWMRSEELPHQGLFPDRIATQATLILWSRHTTDNSYSRGEQATNIVAVQDNPIFPAHIKSDDIIIGSG